MSVNVGSLRVDMLQLLRRREEEGGRPADAGFCYGVAGALGKGDVGRGADKAVRC